MKKSNIFKAIIIILLPLVVLLTTVEKISFDVNYFDKKYAQYNISEETGIEKEDLSDITKKLLSYLKDESDNLKIEKEVNGVNQEVFGEREALHMVDVKNLFLKGHRLRNLSLLALVLSFIFLIKKDRKAIGNSLIISSTISLSLIAILFSLMYMDFNKYFTYFHQIFFTNDLWLLDPETDILIQMLPLDFFYSIASKIIGFFIFELITILGLGLYLKNAYKTSITGNN